MSDYTNGNYNKSSYTKTGKKVKCINSGQIDLIYKKVYDVFIGVNGEEFVIDEAGDWHYDIMDFPCWLEVFDDVAEATNNVNDTNEVNLKFKVGDKVKVVDIEYISQDTSDIKVGDIGVITYVDSDYVMSPYRVDFDYDYWWFTDKCIELVDDVDEATNTTNNVNADNNVNDTNETKPKFKVGDTGGVS